MSRAQTGPVEPDEVVELNEVIVTGSYIKGTAVDAALPVQVFSRDQLEAVGNPTLIEFTRSLGASSGINSESNQYGSNRLEGVANINLRGLGAGRTLVLINGQRQVSHPIAIAEQAQLFVDTNSIPAAALERVEVLKDGAAATYGSDAIAGVVNFITRSGFEGWDIGGSYKYIDGSDGDWDANVTYGLQGEKASWVTTVGYVHRSELSYRDRDWAIQSFADTTVDLSPASSSTPILSSLGSWSSTGNPGRFLAVTTPYTVSTGLYPVLRPNITGSTPRNDAGCMDVQGPSAVDGFGNAFGPVNAPILGNACAFHSTNYANFTEEEDRYQLFSEFNYNFDGGSKFHAEVLYAKTDGSAETSPSYPPQVFNYQFVPANNPGLIDAVARFPAAYPGGFPNGAVFRGRAIGVGGLPGQGDSGTRDYRNYDTIRLATSYGGQFVPSFLGGANYKINVSYGQAEADTSSVDVLLDRFRLALAGYGGPACNAATGTPGVGGCLWYNPFSSSIRQNALGGEINPNYVPALANSQLLTDWLRGENGQNAKTQLFVVEAVMDGQLGLDFGAGELGWAFGAQFRKDKYDLNPYAISDLAINPCPTPGDMTCPGFQRNGTTYFIPGNNALHKSGDVSALFGELSVPLPGSVDVQVAARYEDYGGQIGSTFNPKLSVRWQVAEPFALRASAQTTFRGPTLNQLGGSSPSLQFFAAQGIFKAYDVNGDPDLQPETATNFNIGGIFRFDDIGGFNISFLGTVDYWNFKLKDPILVEDFNQVLDLAGPTCAAGNPIVTNRMTFQSGAPGLGCGDIGRVQGKIINGPEQKTDGIDVAATFTFHDAFGGRLSVGADVAYQLSFDVGAFTIEGLTVAPLDGIGKLNASNFLRPLPQYKANAQISYDKGPHTLNVVAHYVTDYIDERIHPGTKGANIDSNLTFDVTYGLQLPSETRLSLSVFNLTDENPPQVYVDQNYDAYTHNPYGRMVKVGISQRF